MTNLSQQLADIGQTNMETAMRLATISWDRTERLMQLQTETASQLFEKTSRMRELEWRASAEAQRLGSRATEEARDHASKAKKSKSA